MTKHEAIYTAVEELFKRYPMGYGTLHEQMSWNREIILSKLKMKQYDGYYEELCKGAHVPYGELISIIALAGGNDD